MWPLYLLLLVQPAPATAAVEHPQTPEEPPTPVFDHGPLRLEIGAMFDARLWFRENQLGQRPSELQMQLRVVGDRLGEIARYGNVIFTEAVDDTGKSLLKADAYTEEDKTVTRPQPSPIEELRKSGLRLPARLDSPSRAANTIRLRGSIRLILGQDKRAVTIDKPLQYLEGDGQVKNDELHELGVGLRIRSAEDLKLDAKPPPPGKILVLQYLQGQEKVHSVTLYDGWLKEIPKRERQMTTTDGADVLVLTLAAAEIDVNTQLVLEVFPKIEDIRLPVEIDAQPLP